MRNQELKTVNIDPIESLKQLTQKEFALRAKQYDDTYSFPKENFQALFDAGLNAPTISKEFGGMGLPELPSD